MKDKSKQNKNYINSNIQINSTSNLNLNQQIKSNISSNNQNKYLNNVLLKNKIIPSKNKLDKTLALNNSITNKNKTKNNKNNDAYIKIQSNIIPDKYINLNKNEAEVIDINLNNQSTFNKSHILPYNSISNSKNNRKTKQNQTHFNTNSNSHIMTIYTQLNKTDNHSKSKSKVSSYIKNKNIVSIIKNSTIKSNKKTKVHNYSQSYCQYNKYKVKNNLKEKQKDVDAANQDSSYMKLFSHLYEKRVELEMKKKAYIKTNNTNSNTYTYSNNTKNIVDNKDNINIKDIHISSYISSNDNQYKNNPSKKNKSLSLVNIKQKYKEILTLSNQIHDKEHQYNKNDNNKEMRKNKNRSVSEYVLKSKPKKNPICSKEKMMKKIKTIEENEKFKRNEDLSSILKSIIGKNNKNSKMNIKLNPTICHKDKNIFSSLSLNLIKNSNIPPKSDVNEDNINSDELNVNTKSYHNNHHDSNHDHLLCNNYNPDQDIYSICKVLDFNNTQIDPNGIFNLYDEYNTYLDISNNINIYDDNLNTCNDTPKNQLYNNNNNKKEFLEFLNKFKWH